MLEEFLQEIMILRDINRFAFKSHFSPAFLPEIPSGNFLFHPEISNFTPRQFLHETRNVAILIYKNCIRSMRAHRNKMKFGASTS